MFTPKLPFSFLTRSTTKMENFKSIFPTVSYQQFCPCHSALSLDVEKWVQKSIFQVIKRYTERENLTTMHFFLLFNNCKQTRLMPASVHATVSGCQHSAWVFYVLTEFRFSLVHLFRFGIITIFDALFKNALTLTGGVQKPTDVCLIN